MSGWSVDSLVSGSSRLGQTLPQTAAYINQRSINYQGWVPTQAKSSPQGDNAAAGYSSKKCQSPGQVTQSQKKPAAGWEVALEELTVSERP